MKTTTPSKATIRINKAFDQMSKAIHNYLNVCTDNQNPVKRVEAIAEPDGSRRIYINFTNP